MNSSLKAFFEAIAVDTHLQERLYRTQNVADVAVIANELGFAITPIDVLKAQAGRLIELAVNKPEEAQLAAAGKKPNIGAQWGREGCGFLECAGYWLIQFQNWGVSIQSVNSDLEKLFLKLNENNELRAKLNDCKTMDDVAKVVKENGFLIPSVALLTYQALCILLLNDEYAHLVASGSVSHESS